jgi:hypothetical protein
MICEDDEGEEHEIVVKLSGNPQMSPGGFFSEAMASKLANAVDLNVPIPYKVEISREFADSVQDAAIQPLIEASVGLNFGSSKWAAGTTIWPKDKPVKKSMRQGAAEIFAFDAILQNPDRRVSNPNCAYLGNELLIFDHEAAFSQFLDIFPSNPWDNDSLRFLSDHIFKGSLAGGDLDLDRLDGAFRAVDEPLLESFSASIPDEWEGTTITREKITSYLLECRDNFGDIRKQLEAVL